MRGAFGGLIKKKERKKNAPEPRSPVVAHDVSGGGPRRPERAVVHGTPRVRDRRREA